jgi:hypothetical protein
MLEWNREYMPENFPSARAEMPLQGIGEDVAFQEAIANTMANQPPTTAEQRQLRYDPHSLGEADQLLRKQGLNLSPLAAPSARDLKKFSPEDWRAIRESQDPSLKLWSTRYAHNTQEQHANHGQSHYHTKRTTERIQHETALARSLPVIQRTSLQALGGAMTEGVFRSNRGLHDSGVDVTAGATNTDFDDRALGLDNYIFADYGRPSSNNFQNTEVAVVFEPEIMQQPGAFLTEKDIKDLDLRDPDTLEINYRKYMAGAVLPEDFQQAFVPKILTNRSLRTYYAGKGLGNSSYLMEVEDFVAGSDSEPDQSGQPHFSTWEAKIPGEVPTAAIRKLVFTTEEGRQDFVEKFGDAIPCEVAKPEDLKANPSPGNAEATADRYKRNMKLYGTQERYEQELSKLRDEDHSRRQAVVADSEDSGEGYMLIKHPAPNASDAVKYNPQSHAISRRVFASKEDALLMARRDYDPGAEHAMKAALGEEVQVKRNGVLLWEKAQRREIEVHTPTVTIARVQHSPEAAVMTDLSVEDISSPEQ